MPAPPRQARFNSNWAMSCVSLIWPACCFHPRSAAQLDDCHRIGQALSTLLRRRAEEAIASNNGRPVVYSYQCDGPPHRLKKTEHRSISRVSPCFL